MLERFYWCCDKGGAGVQGALLKVPYLKRGFTGMSVPVIAGKVGSRLEKLRTVLNTALSTLDIFTAVYQYTETCNGHFEIF